MDRNCNCGREECAFCNDGFGGGICGLAMLVGGIGLILVAVWAVKEVL
jgi:hypothetical protein